eukprot:CAMPEP_0178975362 /NCGR_PEP_ID=MMETSP0789-20121207/23091_1 /TAXON_ID=3005 /ORGANISM="Rhizosolenia setigera, Strain CCMP 1694" /LENGTH=357 /DNA_ID=CAMNT_0020664041 /DNA_START=154 /DNA_END=1227 /DNA_ORIENTATION=+
MEITSENLDEEFVNTIRIDESLGDDEKLFGLSINNRTGLINGLTPKYMEARTKRMFFSQLEDFTGYPRTQAKSNDIGEYLNDFIIGFRNIYSKEANLVKAFSDNGFRNNNRNVLLQIKSESQLEEIITDLQNESQRLLGIFRGNLSGILQQACGHKTVEECNALAEASMIYRIGKDTLERYQNLLLHLYGTTVQDGWDETKAQLKHHGDRMAKIRNQYRSREAVMCRLYIYLRDGMNKNWSNTKLVQDQMRRLRKQVTAGSSVGKVTPRKNPVYCCKHCNSSLHSIGKETCPFEDHPAAVARMKARQAIRLLADPNFDPHTFQITTDSLSDDDSFSDDETDTSNGTSDGETSDGNQE